MTRTKWNGKDWREFACGECGYWIQKSEQIYLCRKYGLHDNERSRHDRACPDFEPRDIPDPEFPDERINLDHIREEDRQ